MNNKSIMFLSCSLLCMIFISCSGNGKSKPSQKTDLSKNEQKLLGTWKHVSTEGDGLGAGPVDGTFEWTFKADGMVKYLQRPKNMDANSREFHWSLDGDYILFGNDSTYRVEEYGKNKMKWYNYTLAKRNDNYANIYVVERQ